MCRSQTVVFEECQFKLTLIVVAQNGNVPVVVDSVIQSLPFSKEGLSIQDTGAMYVINTPAGISIKWAHVTGIIDIQYGLHSNTSMKTEGLCACTDNKGQPHSAGEIWNGSMRGCCMYNCLENGSVVAVEPECNEDPPPVCEREGEVIVHVIEERACCPKKVCEKDDVCIFQEVTVLNPGQSVIQHLDGDLCYTVQCLQEKDQNTGYNAMHFTMVNCSQQCEAHQIYIPSSSHQACCGTCQNVSCPVRTENGTLIAYENGGIVQTYNDGCCKTCKKEERICQKMTIRTTIRKNDCISQSPINVASCDGKCPSATIFNVNIDSHLRFCKCCRENGTRNLTVPLRCSGNGTEIINSFNLQNVRNISKVEQKPVSTTILLEENKKYDITIESLKNGRVIRVKSFKTPVSPPTAVYIHPEDVQEESIILHWKLPPEGQESYIQVKPNADIGETKKFLLNNTEEFKVDLLIPGMAYEIAVASVNNGNMSELKTIQCTLKPKPVQIVVPYVLYSNAVVLFVRVPDIGVFDGIYVTSKGGPNATFILKSDGKVTIENLTAGTEYDFCVSTKSGKMLSSFYHVSGVKTCLAAPLNVREGNVTDTSIQIAWDRADGDFQQYEVTCTNCASAFRVQKVKQETAKFSNLTPGKLYNFTIRTEKEGFRDSIFVTKEIETDPDPPSDVQVFGQEENTVYFSWKLPRGGFDMFQLSYYLMNNEKLLTRTVYDSRAVVKNLAPGTEYFFQLRTVKGLDSSVAVEKKVITKPAKPEGLKFFNVSSYSFSLYWRLPYGHVDRFHVDLAPDHGSVVILDLGLREYQVAAENSAGVGIFSDPFLFQTAESAPGKVVNLTVEALNYSAVNLIWFLPRQPNGKITSFKISVKHARSGIVVKDVLVKVEDLLSGRLPECNDNSESFLWSTTTPSTTFGKSTIPSRTTVTPSTEATSQMSSVWNEPISFVITNLRPYTTYLFEVSAVTTEAGYIDSAIVRTPESVPEDPPQNFAKSNITAKSFSVMWDPPTIVTGRFSYRVELYGPSGHILDNSTKDHKFVFSNLVPFTTYDVYVGAETSAGLGPKTNLTVFTPADDNQYTINILAEELSYVIKGLVPFTDYTISVSAFTAVGEGPPSVLTVRTREQGLKKYTNYKMRVAASTTIGESALSEENDVFVRTPEDEPDSPPQNVELINVTATEINLRWLPPEQPNGLITHFEVLYSDSNDLFIKNASSTSISLSEMKPYTLYNISIRAFTRLGHGNQSSSPLLVRTLETDLKKYTEYTVEVSASTTMGEGLHSAPLHILTDEDAPSSPPESLSVKQLSGVTVKLSWKPPLEPNGIILYYTVYVWNKMSKRSVNVTETSLQFTDLENNYEYSAYLTASTRFGDGNIKSDTIIFRTSEGAPSDPPKDVVYRNLTSTSITLFWSPPQKPNGNILYYSVYFKNNSGIFIQNFTSYGNDSDASMPQSAVLDDLAKYSHYTLWLTASTAFGDGNKTSEIIDVYTDQDMPLSPPQNLTITNYTADSVWLKWDPSPQPNGVIMRYNFKIYQNNTEKLFYQNISGSRHEANLVGLQPFSPYFISVSAFTKLGNGNQFSNAVHFITMESG
ncbi:phosphatidylinositol phosphatase PTPRQ [Grus japonensis]|uniref:Phosphatidylinositol phosphatase PTPRQ n=1 Tax=Grus japonensis TaxID=30415 RepID=A0ABC9VUI0_GRUJA